MTFKREIWQEEKITEKQPVGWLCGNCWSGNLRLPLIKTVHSKDGKFAGIMKCTNPKCNEEYSVSGSYNYIDSRAHYKVSKEYALPKYKAYYPLFFTKAIRFFQIPQNINNTIQAELDYAFGHFWNDSASCANAIRRSVELLLDDLKVIELVNLHQRIEAFQKSNSDIGSKIMSIKWIGNAGSHKDKPTREDLLDAFEILDYCFEKLFPNNEREERINSISNNINQNKNIRSKN